MVIIEDLHKDAFTFHWSSYPHLTLTLTLRFTVPECLSRFESIALIVLDQKLPVDK